MLFGDLIAGRKIWGGIYLHRPYGYDLGTAARVGGTRGSVGHRLRNKFHRGALIEFLCVSAADSGIRSRAFCLANKRGSAPAPNLISFCLTAPKFSRPPL